MQYRHNINIIVNIIYDNDMKFLILIYWHIHMCVLIKLMVKTLLVHLVVVYSGAYLLACVLMNV